MSQTEIKDIVDKFKRNKANYEKTFLKVNWSEGETRFYPLKIRYTKLYQNYILAKIINLKDLRLYSFITLTTKAGQLFGESELDAISRAVELAKKKWKYVRDIFVKNGIKKPMYIRSFEFAKTDNRMFHLHISIFTAIPHQLIEKIARFWAKKVGYQKVYLYHSHEIASFEDKQTLYAEELEGWALYSEDGKFEHFEWKEKGKKKVGHKAVTYVMKYTVKAPGLESQALMSYFKLRSYSISRSVSDYLKYFQEEYKNQFEVEELGRAVDIGILYKHQYDSILLVRKNKILGKLADRWQKAKYIIELTRTYGEYEKINFHWYIDYTGRGVRA